MMAPAFTKFVSPAKARAQPAQPHFLPFLDSGNSVGGIPAYAGMTAWGVSP